MKLPRKLRYLLLIIQIADIVASNSIPKDELKSELLDNLGEHTDLLIIDTDAGIDDAAAIMLLLEGEKRNTIGKIVAITTVRGNTDVHNVTENVLTILNQENRLDISVFKGANLGLAGLRESDLYFGENGLGDVPLPSSGATERNTTAANVLVHIVNKYPGQVTLLTLGPLTNIAIALSLDNLFLTKVKKWVGMGGSNHGLAFESSIKGVEPNFLLDPVSASFVYTSVEQTTNSTILLPWDPVELMQIKVDWRSNTLGKLESKRVKFLNYVESNIEPEHYYISCDTVAALMLIDPTIIKEMSYHAIDVITGGIPLIVRFTFEQKCSRI